MRLAFSEDIGFPPNRLENYKPGPNMFRGYGQCGQTFERMRTSPFARDYA
jgi:hypothetical protein